jgi:membrane protein required for colicin V production
MNALDLIVLAVIVLSGLFAFARGFVKEALSLGAWVGAGLATLYGFPHARGVARGLIGEPMIADAVAGLTVFLLSLIVLSLIGSAIAGRVRTSSLSALDRTLGFVFGLVRGIVICALAYMAFSWSVSPEDWPDWARAARTRPLLASASDALKSLVPGEARARSAAAAEEARRAIEQAREADRAIRALSLPNPVSGKPPSGAPQAAPKAYNASERKDMDRLFQNAQ